MTTMPQTFRLTTCLAMVATIALTRVPVTALAQSVPPAPAAATSQTDTSPDRVTPMTTADLARIRQALSTSPSLNLDKEQLRYYVRILAKQPNFADFTKGYDFINGPTRGGNPMSHAEFLNMVTPKELHSSGGITAMDTLQFAFTNWLGQSLVKKAIEDLRNAKDEKEVEAIRQRIELELAALRPPGASN
jgi:hypothetical protein